LYGKEVVGDIHTGRPGFDLSRGHRKRISGGGGVNPWSFGGPKKIRGVPNGEYGMFIRMLLDCRTWTALSNRISFIFISWGTVKNFFAGEASAFSEGDCKLSDFVGR